MKGVTTLLFTVFCVAIIVWAAVPKTQAYELKTKYTIEIHEDGMASWVIEQSAYLQTQDDQTSFRQLYTRAITYIDQFASNVSTIINQAHSRTGRVMTAEHIAVGGNITKSDVGAYGFLKYSFDWTSFATVENAKITIGDAFSNESFIFGNGGLSILLPTGYNVKSYSPSPDYDSNSLLKWNNVSDLRNGQPAILLSKAEGISFLQAPPVIFGVLLTITGTVLASVMALRIRKRKKESTLDTIPDESIKGVGDIERILALLKKEGGQALQSRITEQLKFSKAKTSRILGDMENKRIVKRHKNGRDKVVSIQREAEKARN